MKDPRLARIQFFTGMAFFAATGMIIFACLIPQFRVFQEIQDISVIDLPRITAMIAMLPVMTENSNTRWQKNVLDVLSADSSATRTVMTQIKGNPKALQALGSLPGTLGKIPLTVIAYGSYNALQQFIERIQNRFPYAAIRSITIKNIETHAVAPEESPILECTLQMEMLIQNPAQ